MTEDLRAIYAAAADHLTRTAPPLLEASRRRLLDAAARSTAARRAA